MKKAIFLFAAFVSSFILADAQKVQNRDKVTVGYITDEGVVLDSAYNTVGYFKDDGSVMNANYTVVGYIKRDGTVKTSMGQRLGSISSQGLIYNARKVHIGTIGANGVLMDSQGMTVATLKNVEEDLGAVSIFFFFKLAGVDYYNDYSPASNSTTVSLSKSR